MSALIPFTAAQSAEIDRRIGEMVELVIGGRYIQDWSSFAEFRHERLYPQATMNEAAFMPGVAKVIAEAAWQDANDALLHAMQMRAFDGDTHEQAHAVEALVAYGRAMERAGMPAFKHPLWAEEAEARSRRERQRDHSDAPPEGSDRETPASDRPGRTPLRAGRVSSALSLLATGVAAGFLGRSFRPSDRPSSVCGNTTIAGAGGVASAPGKGAA